MHPGNGARLGHDRRGAAAAAAHPRAVRRPAQPVLLGHRAREPGRALLHHRCRGLAGQRGADGPGRLRHLPRVDQRADLRDRGRADPHHGGAGRLGARHRRYDRLLDLEQELHHDQRLHRQLDERRRHLGPELVEHHALQQPRQQRRAAGQRPEQIRHLPRQRPRLDRRRQHRRSQHELRDLPERLHPQPREGQRDLQQRPGFRARRIRDPALQLDEQHDRFEPHAQQRGLGDRVLHGREQQPHRRQRQLRQRRPRHRQLRVDGSDHPGQHRLPQRHGRHQHRGRARPGRRSPTTSASTTASRAHARTATSGSRTDRRPARRWTTTSRS